MNKFRIHKDNTVLFIVDLQERLMKAMDEREKVIKNNLMLLTLADLFSLPVVVSEQYPQGLGSTVEVIKKQLPAASRFIEKTTFSACTAEFLPVFQGLERKTILVTGTETHVCVYQSVRDLLVAGYNVHVARDAVCSRFKENFKNGLQLMKEMGAVINNTESVIFDMLGIAGTKEFQTMSKLLK